MQLGATAMWLLGWFLIPMVLYRLFLRLVRVPTPPGGTGTYPRAQRTMPDPSAPDEQRGTWTLRTCTGESPLGAVKHTLNEHAGRQYWHFDPLTIPSTVETAALNTVRGGFVRSRIDHRHSADEPYRLQCKRSKGAVSDKEEKRARPSEAKTQVKSPAGKSGRKSPAGKSASSRRASVCVGGGGLSHRLAGALRSAICFEDSILMEDGHLPGDYGGPMFLLPGIVIACYVTETALPEAHRFEMLRYIRNHQRDDGGMGLHIEGHSTMFGTSLNYVAARILGLSSDDPFCVAARDFLHSNGMIPLPHPTPLPQPNPPTPGPRGILPI